jgi:hypothetical protein
MPANAGIFNLSSSKESERSPCSPSISHFFSCNTLTDLIKSLTAENSKQDYAKMVQVLIQQNDGCPELTQDISLVPENKPNILESYNLDNAIDGWDQIGSLTSEVASSAMAKQASIICERFRDEDETRSPNRANKRRKLETPKTTETDPNFVTSDEDSNASHEGLSGGLSRQIDRMGRMSKLIMSIDHCHRLLRAEMLAMGEDNDLRL